MYSVWIEYLEVSKDSIPSNPTLALEEMRRVFFSASFPEFYDLVEVLYGVSVELRKDDMFVAFCNEAFEKQKAQLRFVSGQLAPIVDTNEVPEVNAAVEQTLSSTVAQHMSRTIELYAHRTSPDYRNSIKEQFSVDDYAAKVIAQEDTKTLGDALKVLEKQGALHPALKNGFLASTAGQTMMKASDMR